MPGAWAARPIRLEEAGAAGPSGSPEAPRRPPVGVLPTTSLAPVEQTCARPAVTAEAPHAQARTTSTVKIPGARTAGPGSFVSAAAWSFGERGGGTRGKSHGSRGP
jgi:hypothetical protein